MLECRHVHSHGTSCRDLSSYFLRMFNVLHTVLQTLELNLATAYSGGPSFTPLSGERPSWPNF